MNHLKRTVIAGLVTLSMITSLAACGGKDTAVDAPDDGSEMTVEVFDALANYQGEQKGWFAKLIKDKFNIKLNIIAPNVAGGGSTLFDTRSAAGNLGDIIIMGSGSGQAERVVKAGLVADLSDYIDDTEYLKQYQGAIDELTATANQQDGVWGIPTSVSSLSPSESSEGVEPTFGPFVRWDYYKAIGYPQVATLEDLLPVLKDMQDKARATEGTNDIYALSLFKDWDGEAMQNGYQFPAFYGYAEGLGYVLTKYDGSDYQSLIDENSQYVRALRFFNKAYQMGLVDPESTTQNYDTMYSKYKEGKVLFSFWPWLGQAAYNTTANKEAGKGFMMLDIDDMTIASKGAQPNGTSTFIAVGAKAKNKERLVKFIDWLYSPEGIQASGSQTNGAAGIEGLTWQLNDAGAPKLTDFGVKAVSGESVNVPEEYGGGGYTDGASQLNVSTVLNKDTDPNTGAPYNYQMWDSELAKRDTALDKDWQEHMGGARTTMEFLEANDKLAVIPGATYVAPDEDSKITAVRGQIKTAVVNACWQAVFTDSDDEFDAVWSQGVQNVEALGYDEVYQIDLANSKAMTEARQAVEDEYQDRG
ncbi:ABC transporter substrate-binding protein [Bifidobacterium oedipodis]|uniref:ABC transporter substrate-binding protein n=1 Tax=Bifidobacterium oedipodis TaxID=2675322 RepID=A0A7Y0ER52_9BIFI|nr:ABC transporter substrate-binding protein [Bifidobacterium sp. DSM 109957]NMM94926.1 ABC transporter substrate-binding protein [Bifidobacterium sp. DSM 109957]